MTATDTGRTGPGSAIERAEAPRLIADPETPEPELTRDQRRDERQRLKVVRRTRRCEVLKKAYNGKNRAKGKHAKGKKR